MYSGSLNSIETVRKWFFELPDDYRFWTLYRESKKGSRIMWEEDDKKDKNGSWAKLQTTLIEQSSYGGHFYLFATDKPKGNAGPDTQIYLPPNHSGVTAGINGYPQQAGVYGYGENPQDFKARVEREAKEKWELEQKIKDIENKGSFWEKVAEKVISHPRFDPNVAIIHGGKLFDRVLDIALPQKTAAAISGYPPQYVPPKSLPTTQQPVTDDTEEYDIDIVNNVLAKVETIFGVKHSEIYLQSLADFLMSETGKSFVPTVNSFIQAEYLQRVEKYKAYKAQGQNV